MKKASHVSGELFQRQYPQIWDYAYFPLRNIKKLVRNFADSISTKHYSILDMGCGNKPYKFLFRHYKEYIWSDVVPGPFVDAICDNADLAFEDNRFDYLICNQVLEHTRDLHGAVDEIQRVVKKDWTILVSVPFLYPEHACPWDYWRFTRFWIEELFKNFEIISIKNDTSYFITLWTFVNMLFTKWKIIRIIFSPLFVVINILSLTLDSLVKLFYNVLWLKRVAFVKNAIENTYNQFTLNYVILLKNSKK